MIAALLLLVAAPGQAQAPPQLGVEQQAAAGELARLMLAAPEMTAALRRSFEEGVARELEHPSEGTSGADLEPALRAMLVTAEGDDYVHELTAGLPKPLAAAQAAFARGLAKHELDRLTDFLRTSGGRKFIAFSLTNAAALHDGTMTPQDAGEALVKQLTQGELADLEAAMEPGLLAHWKAAMESAQPALAAWRDGAVTRTAMRAEATAKRVAKAFYVTGKQP